MCGVAIDISAENDRTERFHSVSSLIWRISTKRKQIAFLKDSGMNDTIYGEVKIREEEVAKMLDEVFELIG